MGRLHVQYTNIYCRFACCSNYSFLATFCTRSHPFLSSHSLAEQVVDVSFCLPPNTVICCLVCAHLAPGEDPSTYKSFAVQCLRCLGVDHGLHPQREKVKEKNVQAPSKEDKDLNNISIHITQSKSPLQKRCHL